MSIYQAELEAQYQELVEANLRIEAQMFRLEALFEEAPLPYLLVGKNGAVLQWNAAAAAAAGLREKLWLGGFVAGLFEASGKTTLRHWLLNTAAPEAALLAHVRDRPDLQYELRKSYVDDDKILISAVSIRPVPGHSIDGQDGAACAYQNLKAFIDDFVVKTGEALQGLDIELVCETSGVSGDECATTDWSALEEILDAALRSVLNGTTELLVIEVELERDPSVDRLVVRVKDNTSEAMSEPAIPLSPVRSADHAIPLPRELSIGKRLVMCMGGALSLTSTHSGARVVTISIPITLDS